MGRARNSDVRSLVMLLVKVVDYSDTEPLQAGMPVPQLSKYLGHKDPAFTSRVYAHMLPDANERASEALEAMFGAVMVEAHESSEEPAA